MVKKVTDKDHEGRRKRMAVLEEHLADWMKGRSTPDMVTDLADLLIALLARGFPPTLTSADREKIRDNCPSATESLTAERAMSAEGVMFALALGCEISKIAIDYSSLSHCKRQVNEDEKHQSVIRDVLEPAVSAAYEASVHAGLSPYGASTMLILLGAINGMKHGVSCAAISRPLIDSIEITMSRGGARDVPAKHIELSPEDEERAIQLLMAQMGISRKEAKKYADFAKQRMREER